MTFSTELRIHIIPPERSGPLFASLSVELPFAPTAETGLLAPPWTSAKKPNEITYFLETAKFLLEFATLYCNSNEEFNQTVEDYRLHGWTVE